MGSTQQAEFELENSIGTIGVILGVKVGGVIDGPRSCIGSSLVMVENDTVGDNFGDVIT